MDSIEVTARRTAAATALAAKHLARSESETVLICGCGQQAAAQLDALRGVMKIKRGYCWDGEDSRAAAFAQEHGFTQVDDLPTAALASDVIVTCTTSTEPFLAAEMAKPGSFIAAVGADAPHKSEIEPSLMARARVVTDLTKQCTVMGDLHHAIEGGAMCAEDVHAELGEIVVRAKSGRTRGDEIIVFDSTGVAVQDVASAVEIYRRALAAGARTRIALGV
jgi:ornithine cyclodeaminase/alanine dehydrogenase-like protein (mu-crystallin family)